MVPKKDAITATPPSSKSKTQVKNDYKQWFMGTVLCPTPITMKPGHPGLELALVAFNTYGFYDANGRTQNTPSIWSIGPFIDFQVGFNKIFGAEIIGSLPTSICRGETSTYLEDTIFRFGIQISNDDPHSWVPDFRILFQETLPTGHYQKLNPKKNRADCTGEGSFQTGGHFAFQKLFHPQKDHDFRLRWSLGYFFPSSVHVKGFNFFGGNADTLGVAYPGSYFDGFLCGEYSLSRTWALALETNYIIGTKGRFSRKSGPQIDVPNFNQFSLAPEIQHTFKENLGIILGSWFTVGGKNTAAFRAFFFSVLYIF